MPISDIEKGLKQLGFTSGWAINGNEITLWEHDVPQPSQETILEAAKSFAEPKISIAEKLNSVGLTVDELKEALGLG